MLRERILQSLESAASLYAHGQIGPGVFDHPVESRHREDQVGGMWLIAPAAFRAAAAWDNAEPGGVRAVQRRGQFFFATWLEDRFRLHSSDAVARAGGANLLGASNGPEVVPWDRGPSSSGCRQGRHFKSVPQFRRAPQDEVDTPPAVHRTTAVGEKFSLDLRAAPGQMRSARAALFLDRAPHTSLTSSFSSLHRHHVPPR